MRRCGWIGLAHDSTSWMRRHVRDPYVKKSQQEGLRARSAYKLLEIQQKHRLIRANSKVLDLGAAPGGWSVVTSQILAKNTRLTKEIKSIGTSAGGLLVSVDLLPIDPIDGALFIQGDFNSEETQTAIERALGEGQLFDVILSDMLHNATGQRDLDHFKSMALCHSVLAFSGKFLSMGGSMLCKYYQGEDEKDWLQMLRERFMEVKTVKPKSSRSESKEVYVLAMKKK